MSADRPGKQQCGCRTSGTLLCNKQQTVVDGSLVWLQGNPSFVWSIPRMGDTKRQDTCT